MKKIIPSLFVSVSIVFIWLSPCVSQTLYPDELAKFYATIIDDYIRQCQAKSSLLDSGSYHIRTIAIRASLKSAYLESNKDELVEYLIENKVSLNKDRIIYHLNRSFFDKVRQNEIYSLVTVNRALTD